MDNSNGYSLTQGGNLAALIGALAVVLKLFHVNITSDELQLAAGAVITLVGIAVSWYGRWRKGDITFGGFRK